MFEERKIVAKYAELKALSEKVDKLLKANSEVSSQGSVRSTDELLAAGKRLEEISDLNLKIAKLKQEISKLEDKKFIKDHRFKKG